MSLSIVKSQSPRFPGYAVVEHEMDCPPTVVRTLTTRREAEDFVRQIDQSFRRKR